MAEQQQFERNLKLTKLKSEYQLGKISGIAAVGGTIQFVYQGAGEFHGYLLRPDGGIKRFESDTAAWRYIEAKII